MLHFLRNRSLNKKVRFWQYASLFIFQGVLLAGLQSSVMGLEEENPAKNLTPSQKIYAQLLANQGSFATKGDAEMYLLTVKPKPLAVPAPARVAAASGTLPQERGGEAAAHHVPPVAVVPAVKLNIAQDTFMMGLHRFGVAIRTSIGDLLGSFDMLNKGPTEKEFQECMDICGLQHFTEGKDQIRESFESLPKLLAYYTKYRLQIGTPQNVGKYFEDLNKNLKQVLDPFFRSIDAFLGKERTLTQSKRLHENAGKINENIVAIMDRAHISENTKTLRAYFYDGIQWSEQEREARRLEASRMDDEEKAAAQAAKDEAERLARAQMTEKQKAEEAAQEEERRIARERAEQQRRELEARRQMEIRLAVFREDWQPFKEIIEAFTAHKEGRDDRGYSIVKEGIMRLGSDANGAGFPFLQKLRKLLPPLFVSHNLLYIEPVDGVSPMGFGKEEAVAFYKQLVLQGDVDVFVSVQDAFMEMEGLTDYKKVLPSYQVYLKSKTPENKNTFVGEVFKISLGTQHGTRLLHPLVLVKSIWDQKPASRKILTDILPMYFMLMADQFGKCHSGATGRTIIMTNLLMQELLKGPLL